MKRKIPSIMFSQHPDHARVPFWHKRALIKTHDELKESFIMFSQLGGQEMMWDWEGKLVDDSVVERLLSKHTDFFTQFPIGKDLFITFRVPNPRIESGYRLGRAFMVILAAEHLAKSLQLSDRPLFEVILPMTETATEMITLRESYKRIAEAAHASFAPQKVGMTSLEIIPIFESVSTILKSAQLLTEYVALSTNSFNEPIAQIRPFLARSDPALNSGIVATTLAIKWALSEYATFTKNTGIATYPIIAPGVLPFRGGLNPETYTAFLQEFAGVKTIVIQSAFRYDYPLEQVKTAIEYMKKQLPKSMPLVLPPEMLPQITRAIDEFEKPYKEQVETLIPLINRISGSIPIRRERAQHIGLFGYSRQAGTKKLPRAIGFTASLYSLGIPPELLGIGEALVSVKAQQLLPLVESLYHEFKPALRAAGGYFRPESLKELELTGLKLHIFDIEEFIGQKLGPKTDIEFAHAEVVKQIITQFKKGKDIHDLIEQAALLRRSLG